MNTYQINLFLSESSAIYYQLKKVMAKKFDNPFIPKYIPNDLP